MLNWTKKYRLIALVCVIFITATPSVYAQKAGLMLFPTRFVLDESERSVAIDIINKGDARGSYRIEMVDMKMPETGSIRELMEGETEPYSITDFVRISPRRVVLRPNEVQKVRILIRRPGDLPDGEYRSHLKVTLTEDNLDAIADENRSQNISIKIKPRLAFTVPIILRQGKTDYKVSIDDANVYYGERDMSREKPILKLNFSHEGTQSAMGDIKVSHVGPDGTNTVVNFQPGIAIYRDTNRRIVDFPLSLPEGLKLQSGELYITYLEKIIEGETEGKLIAEKRLKL